MALLPQDGLLPDDWLLPGMGGDEGSGGNPGENAGHGNLGFTRPDLPGLYVRWAPSPPGG